MIDGCCLPQSYNIASIDFFFLFPSSTQTDFKDSLLLKAICVSDFSSHPLEKAKGFFLVFSCENWTFIFRSLIIKIIICHCVKPENFFKMVRDGLNYRLFSWLKKSKPKFNEIHPKMFRKQTLSCPVESPKQEWEKSRFILRCHKRGFPIVAAGNSYDLLP